MGIGILSEVQSQSIGGIYGRHFATHGNGHTGLVHGARAGGMIPKARMRLLHFENTFGKTYDSEYCLDAMLSLVLIMARSARPDADRLARLIGATSAAAYPEKNNASPDSAAAVREAMADGVRTTSLRQ